MAFTSCTSECCFSYDYTMHKNEPLIYHYDTEVFCLLGLAMVNFVSTACGIIDYFKVFYVSSVADLYMVKLDTKQNKCILHAI